MRILLTTLFLLSCPTFENAIHMEAQVPHSTNTAGYYESVPYVKIGTPATGRVTLCPRPGGIGMTFAKLDLTPGVMKSS